MPIRVAFRSLALAAALALSAGGAALAQDAAQGIEAEDPPGRVGRLSHTEGTVSFRNADEDQWVPATINFPVTTGASFWTEPNARAEIQIGSTDLRLAQATAIAISRLDDAATEVRLDQGSINLRVRDLPPGGVRIVTPRATVDVLQPGRYHVDVLPAEPSPADDQVRVAVLEGAANVMADGGGAPLTVTTGHSATLRGGGPPLLAEAIGRPLDTWALERERLLDPQDSVRHVSPEMTGYQDLDRYGRWGSDPTYGTVWYPSTVASDWAPYRDGYWSYVRPWGWTWVDHQPWGFAPFHYGRWVLIGSRWGWCPGRRVHRPVYAPALVVFVSGSHIHSHGRRGPAVGWVPLAPHERFRPYYRHSPGHSYQVNATTVNVTVFNRDRDRDGDRDHDRARGYRNRHGMTMVSSQAFTGGAPVRQTRVSLRDEEADSARRAESLDHLRPSRAARAGVAVPAVATTEEPRQPRSRRGERDDDRVAPPSAGRTSGAPAATAANPDVLPKAPGPNRDPRSGRTNREAREQAAAPDTGRAAPADRAPAVTPFERPDRAAPALRQPQRDEQPLGRAPAGSMVGNPPGRIDRPAQRGPSERRDERAPATEHRRPESAAAPRSLSPAQQPGAAPHTVAPTRPAPIEPPRRDDTRSQRPSQRERDTSPRADRPGAPTVSESRREVRPDAPIQRPIQRTEPRREAAPAPTHVAPRSETRPQPVQRIEPQPRPQSQPVQRMERPQDARPHPVQRPEQRREAAPAPTRVAPRPEARPQPVQRVEPQPRPQLQRMERRQDARPQPVQRPEQRREAAPPRRIEQPQRPQPQEAQRPGSGRRGEDGRRSGG